MSPKKKGKRTKSKVSTTKRAKKSSRVKQTARSKKSSGKKQAKKLSSKVTAVRKQASPVRRAQHPKSSFSREGAVPARQAVDFQGLSRTEQANSESVDELVEEGNVFEAGAVAGVEKADDEDTREVHTEEVPEDDVPEEYLDEE